MTKPKKKPIFEEINHLMMDVLTNEHITISTYEEERGKPMPSKKHGWIQANIIGLLFPHKKRIQTFSELNVLVNGKKKIPDIAIYAKGVLDMVEDEVTVETIPLAVIEILSPKQALSELTEKAKEFFDAGVQSYWLVLPEMKAISVYKNKDDYAFFAHDALLKDTILDIELPLEEVFT